MSPPDDAAFDEVREAATDVIAALKKLIDATERVVQDPESFAQVVDGGRGVVEAFVDGLTGRIQADDVGDES